MTTEDLLESMGFSQYTEFWWKKGAVQVGCGVSSVTILVDKRAIEIQGCEPSLVAAVLEAVIKHRSKRADDD